MVGCIQRRSSPLLWDAGDLFVSAAAVVVVLGIFGPVDGDVDECGDGHGHVKGKTKWIAKFFVGVWSVLLLLKNNMGPKERTEVKQKANLRK